MADTETQTSKKKLNELRVIDLRSELEKRGLDKTGVKTSLVERLSKAVQDEGHNPEEFLFDVTVEVVKAPGKTPPMKRPSRKNKDENDSAQDDGIADDDEDEENNKEEMEVDKKELNKEEATAGEKQSQNKTENPESQKNAQCNGNKSNEENDATDINSDANQQLSPRKPETAPVAEDKDTSCSAKGDSSSLKVNDDKKSDIDSNKNEKKAAGTETSNSEASENASATKDNKASVNESEKDTAANADTTQESDKKASGEADKKVAESKSEDKKDTSTDDGKEKAEKDAKHEKEKADKEKKSAENGTASSTTAAKAKSSDDKSGSSDKSCDKIKRVSGSSKNLWVSGLAPQTKAAELKVLFSKYGKVVGSKIVTNAKTPGSRCYGFITMATSKEASACIQHLHRTELHGKIISVEKTTREPSGTIKRADMQAMQAKKSATKKPSPGGSKPSPKGDADKDKADKTEGQEKAEAEKTEAGTEGDEKKKTEDEKKAGKKKTPSKERELRTRSRERRRRRTRSRDRIGRGFRGGFFRGRGFSRFGGRRPFLSGRSFGDRFHRERERARERESERRRFSDLYRQREIERKNREESMRLERERERLRIERERLERERSEVLRMEREKQRLEREKLDRERAELRKRSLMHLDDRRGLKRPFDAGRSGKDTDPFWDERKRQALARDVPEVSPPRFSDFARERATAFPDRRSDRFEARSKDIPPPFPSSGRREGRHESEDRPFNRSSRHREGPERGPREEWKGAKARERFERPHSGGGGRSSFNSSDRARSFDRPHPWESVQSDREPNKFASSAPVAGSQWAPIGKADNWGRMDGPPQDRWGGMDHTRGQPALGLGHQPGMGHPPNQLGMFGSAGNEIMNSMPGSFPTDRFNMNMMRRF